MKIAAVIIGLCALALVGFLAIGWVWLRRVGRNVHAATPPRISMVAESAPDWKDVEAVSRAFEHLKAMRFTPAGTFRIPELDVLAAGFVREEDQLMGAVFEHPVGGVWTDLCIEYEDGGGLSVSNAPDGSEIDVRPGYRKIFEEGLTVVQLVQRIDEERGAEPARTIAPAGFAAALCESYARDYDWRDKRGGVTVQETIRVMENMKEEGTARLPCQPGACPYEYDKGSDREIEGMPFPEESDDPRACPTYRHICPYFMEELGFTVEDLQIRATIHCASVAQTLAGQGKLSPDSEDYKALVARFEEVKQAYPAESCPQYYR